MSFIEVIALIIAGTAAGFINTLAGGGSIISLSLLMFLGLPPTIANGTNRIAIALQTISGTINFKRNNVLDYRKGIKLAIPTVIGSVLGSLLASEINEEVFEKAIAIILLIMLVFIFVNPNKWLKNQSDLIEKSIGIPKYILFFAIGIYGGFIHVGIGYFLLSAIVLGLGYNLVYANAIKIFIVMIYVPITLLVFIYNDQVNYYYGLVLSIGNVIGALVASKFAVEKGANFVRYVILAVILLTVANTFGLVDIQEFFARYIK
jgi:uncharacterized membrane protein YfcA